MEVTPGCKKPEGYREGGIQGGVSEERHDSIGKEHRGRSKETAGREKKGRIGQRRRVQLDHSKRETGESAAYIGSKQLDGKQRPSGDLKCMYTNLDTYVNKRGELRVRIDQQDPDIIGLTEINPKNATWTLQPPDLSIDGYTAFTEFAGRGAALYVKNIYGASEFAPRARSDVAVWCGLNLNSDVNDTDTLVVGLVYRSPNSSDLQNTALENMIREVTQCDYKHLLLFGDFNYPEIDWSVEVANVPANHAAYSFLNCIQDSFLTQHVSRPTHYRHGQTANTLDLIFTGDNRLIADVDYVEPVGMSHHLVLQWTVACRVFSPTVPCLRYRYDKADYKGMCHTPGFKHVRKCTLKKI